jgi:hypothetical protein
MERPSWAPPGIDLSRPSIARVYDCSLGGFHNFAADRAVVERAREVMPGLLAMSRAGRGFLTRAVGYCLQAGVRQFLDIGSGIPTAGNVHEVARAVAPDARVVYVDIDPVAVAHSEAILGDDPDAAVIQADLRDPKRILDHETTHRLLDFDRPIALLMVAVLHFIPDSDGPRGLIEQFLSPLAPGSYLIMSHATADGPPAQQMTQATDMYQRTVGDVAARSRQDVLSLFDGLELVPPGLTWISQWMQPEDAPAEPEPERIFGGYGGVARKP